MRRVLPLDWQRRWSPARRDYDTRLARRLITKGSRIAPGRKTNKNRSHRDPAFSGAPATYKPHFCHGGDDVLAVLPSVKSKDARTVSGAGCAVAEVDGDVGCSAGCGRGRKRRGDTLGHVYDSAAASGMSRSGLSGARELLKAFPVFSVEPYRFLAVPETDKRLIGDDELGPAGMAVANDGVFVHAGLKIPRLAARTEQRDGIPHSAWSGDVLNVRVRVAHIGAVIVTQAAHLAFAVFFKVKLCEKP